MDRQAAPASVIPRIEVVYIISLEGEADKLPATSCESHLQLAPRF